MYKKTIEYTDFNGNKRSKDCYFNLTRRELANMDLKRMGGFDSFIRKMIQANDVPELTELFEQLVLMSYGEVSADGERFIKDDGALAKKFKDSAAYDELYWELISDPDKMSDFINKIVPKQFAEAMDSPETQEKVQELKKEYGIEDK